MKNLPKEERKIVLQDFLNKEHIKSVIIENNLINKTDPTKGGGTNGKLIQAAVCNNPHNFVYGPGAKKKDERGIHRGRDPGDKTDMELLEKQREEYKKNESIQTSVQRSQLKKQSEEYNESIQRDTAVWLQNYG